MCKILIFTNNESIEKHWKRITPKGYEFIKVASLEQLLKSLQDELSTMVMLDENSCDDIVQTLSTLQMFSKVRVILLSSALDLKRGVSLLGYGIKAYENAYVNAQTLSNLLEAVSASKMWIHPDLTTYLITNYVNSKENHESQTPDIEIFTSKEKEVLSLITQGASNAEIAKHLKISLSTVKGHISHIFEKADIKDRVNLALKYKGLV